MIKLTVAATSEVKRLQSKRDNSHIFLRIGVVPSNCADLAYLVKFEEAVGPVDQMQDCGGIQVIVDLQQLCYLDSLTLDYAEDLMGGGFRFYNPKAARTCNCGNSFFLPKTIDTSSPKAI